ncbi:MAG: hypothetical protein GWN47_10745 [Woeseiaceae bacterium]|nr:hypothetical protein [Woeseiaceae bacterium]
MSGIVDFFRELQRRNVVRAAVAHIIVFWVLAQVADVVLPYIGVVENPVRWAIVAGVALFPVTLIVSWFVEHPWKKYTRSRVAIDAAVIIVLAVTAGTWAIRNAPQVIHTKTSIAILPFEHSGDPLEQSVSRALAYEINSLLMKSKSIDVIGFESATSPVLAGMGSMAVADRLSVAHVLSGEVSVRDSLMRISLRLLDDAGTALWESVIEESLDNLFSVQEAIATSIEARLGAGEDVVPVKTVAANRCWMPTDPPALEKYYTARYYVELRTESETSRQQMRDAISVYEDLVEAYPKFADAKSGLAWAIMHQAIYDPQRAMPEPARGARVRALAESALADCPTLGEAMHILPNEYDHPNMWIGSHQQLTAFLEMQPDRNEYYQRLARHYRETGLIDKAVEVGERNYAMNPLSPKPLRILAGVYQYQQRFDEAVELEDLAAELGSTSPKFARENRERAKCNKDLECMLATLPPEFRPFEEELRQIYTPPSDEGEARRAIDTAMGVYTQFPVTINWFNITPCHYEHLTPLFFELWEKNKELRAFWYWPNVWHTSCGNLWAAPEFEAFVEEAGLVEYWREVGWPAMCRPEGDGFECDAGESAD